jgi:hypothetical protein
VSAKSGSFVSSEGERVSTDEHTTATRHELAATLPTDSWIKEAIP